MPLLQGTIENLWKNSFDMIWEHFKIQILKDNWDITYMANLNKKINNILKYYYLVLSGIQFPLSLFWFEENMVIYNYI
jgi:hypothetical protein